MKRSIILIISLLATLGMAAQEQEFIRITTDKDCYLAGEDLWIQVCVNDAAHKPMNISQVAYIEICGPQQVYAEAKIQLTDGEGNGRIRLPRTMHTGSFLLKAYTRYLRNWGEEAFSRKYIAVINTLQSVPEDQMTWTDTLPDISVQPSSTLTTDKEVYNRRSKVKLSWETLPKGSYGVTLSVVRNDHALVSLDQPALPSLIKQPDNWEWTAESEGHIAQAKVVEGQAVLKTARLACAGKDIRLFEGQAAGEGIYTFYTHGIHNMQDIALDAVPQQRGEKGRMEPISPFTGTLPERMPSAHLSCTKEALQERSVNVQLQPLLPNTNNPQSVSESLYNFQPDITYNLDEWVRFTTVRETLIEFVMGVRVIKRNGESIMQLLKEDAKRYSEFKALVLIDGIPIEDHEQALDFDARLLQYIHQYQGGYTFGGQTYDGIISMITHRGTLSGLRLGENTSFLAYEFPQKNIRFPEKLYETEEQKTSRLPDFRHTLYWNPCISPTEQSINFYTSDWKGNYLITLKGYTPDGKMWERKAMFTVK